MICSFHFLCLWLLLLFDFGVCKKPPGLLLSPAQSQSQGPILQVRQPSSFLAPGVSILSLSGQPLHDGTAENVSHTRPLGPAQHDLENRTCPSNSSRFIGRVQGTRCNATLLAAASSPEAYRKHFFANDTIDDISGSGISTATATSQTSRLDVATSSPSITSSHSSHPHEDPSFLSFESNQIINEVKIGNFSTNSSRHSRETTSPPLITPPPMPPLRPGGLNLTGVQVIRATNSSWTTNTSITTFSPGGTQPTVVPVIVKAAGVGLLIFGLTAAQEVGAPLIEIGEAAEVAEEEAAEDQMEEDDHDNEESVSPTRSSIMSTATSRHSSITSSSSSNSASGSSLTSTASSRSSSSASLPPDTCSHPTDFPRLGDQDDEDDPDVSKNSKSKRFVSGGASVARRQLEQLGAYTNMKKSLGRLGSCRLDKSTNLPPFWKANSLIGKSGNSPYWYMPVPEDPSNVDALPTYTTAATEALRTLSPNGKSVIIGGSSGYRTNVDHVYEVSLLKNFFNYYLAQKSICRQFNSEYMPMSRGGNDASRLATIFAQLPGVRFGGLAGMDQRLNSIKAYFFQAGEIQRGLGYQSNGLCDSITNLRLAGIVMDMLHSVELGGFFRDANARIYKALLGTDKAIAGDSSDGCRRSPAAAFSWAAEYKYWIEWFLAEREFEVRKWAADTQAAIIKELNQRMTDVEKQGNGGDTRQMDPVYENDKHRMDAFMKSPYGQASHWSFNFELQYPDVALPMVKREPGDACNQADSTLTLTSATPSSSEMLSTATTTLNQATGQSVVADSQRPSKAAVPTNDVNFIRNGAGKTLNTNSANTLNNGKSGNQFNNAIQNLAAF